MESVNISFSVTGQKIAGCGVYCASNTVHYIIAQFDLDDNWHGFDSVRAVWSNDFKCISTVLDQNGSCTVPHEVLERRGKVSVNLVGSILEDDELTDRLTTYPILAITVDANAKICGAETAEVTPSQFEQFVQIVKDEVAKVKDIDRAELNADYTLTFYFSDGTETTVGPIRGEQGETGNGIESAVLNDDYTLTLTFTDGTEYTTPSIRGEQGEQGEPGEVTLAQLSAVLPTDTASGAIASFEDGSDLFDYLSCIVDIDPVQDLHGYDKPWVGGGGANLLNSDYAIKFTLSKTITFPQTILSSTKVYIHSDGFNYTTPPSSGNKYPYYVFRGANNENCGQVWGLQDTSVTLSGDAVAIELWSNGYDYGASNGVEVTINGLTISLTEQTQWTPYENLCPITGWTGCEVDVAGVNIIPFPYYDGDTAVYGISFSPNNDGTIRLSGQMIGQHEIVYKLIEEYTDKYSKYNGCIISKPSSFPVGVSLNFMDDNGVHTVLGTSDYTIVGKLQRLFVYVESTVTSVDATLAFMIRRPTESATYTPYNGTTYPVSWQTEAGTVYGGTVDLVTGVLTVTHGSIDMGDATWTASGSSQTGIYRMATAISGAKLPANNDTKFEGICSAYEVVTANNTYSTIHGVSISTGGYVIIYDPNYNTSSSPSAFKTAMTGQTLVYELATPITYELDPVQVACLLGQNNVWADCGNVAVKYKADVQKYIDKKTEELSVAILALS